MDREPLAYHNGDFRPQRDAALALNDTGFVMGATVTDLCRTFRHRLFRLSDHLRRFRQSCDLAQVPQPRSDDELAALAERLVAHNASLLPAEHDLALVLFATPGAIGYYLGDPGGPGDAAPTFGMHTFPLPFARYVHLFREGARLVTPRVRQVSPGIVDPRIKQRSRLHWWLAEREVHAVEPGASAMLLDDAGRVTETAAANFLVVRRGAVLSPPRASILNGISLLVAEEICHDLGIPFREQPLPLADCLSADEACLTSTPYGIAGVRELNGAALPWPGPLFRRLRAAWNDRAGLDIENQILTHAAT
jgi:branched-subunit amino acid aminotransferase/4-amino-4-deoxychorismate lyase